MNAHIPAAMQPHYDSGQEARRQGESLPQGRIITAKGAWWRAGWHDADIDAGVSVMEARR